MTKQPRRVMVATPTYTGEVAHECAISMQLATVHCLVNNVLLDWIFAAGFSLVQAGRNWLNQEFISRREFDLLLWLDADLGFDPKAVMALIRTMDAKKIDALCGIYPAKHPTAPFFPFKACGPVVGGLQEVSKVPGGFLMLTRRAVETVSAACPSYEIDHAGEKRMSAHVFEVIVKDGRMWGEDFILSERLINAGFKIYAYTDIGFAHIGRKAWNANLSKTLAEEAAKGVEGEHSPERWKKHAEAPTALPKPTESK